MIGRAARAVAAAGRLTLEPALVRLGVFAAGLTALLVAAGTAGPAGPPGLAVVVAAVLAALPAVHPRGPWVTVVVLAAAVAWVVETGSATVAGTGPAGLVPDPGRVLVVAGALYLVHSLAALAATLPYDAVVAPDVLTRWLLRALGVLVASSLLSVAVLAGLGQVAGGSTLAATAATLAGLALAVALAAALRLVSRRNPTGRS